MGGSPAASTGLLCCKPYRLPPGCTAEYRFAVDRARPFACPEPPLNEEESRLNAFAVLAFCAEITLLPGHWAPRFTPENATAHTTPSRSTMVAHIWLFNPLVSAAVAATSAAFRALYSGSPLHPLFPFPALRVAAVHINNSAKASVRHTTRVDIVSLLFEVWNPSGRKRR